MNSDYTDDILGIRSKYEFMTFLFLTDGSIAVGVIQNETQKIISIYRLDLIADPKDRDTFLKFGDEWWWGSNQSVPINSFIGPRFDQFSPYLKMHSKKILEKRIGPTFSLADKYLKRAKRKTRTNTILG